MSDQPSPVPEMPPGIWRALAIVGVLLTLLIVQMLTVGAPPGTNLAILADLLLGLIAATAGVWVLGGVFNAEGNILGFAVKATGGIALLFMVSFVLRPFYAAGGEVTGPVSVHLEKWTSIGPTLKRFRDEYGNNVLHAIDVQIAPEIRSQVMAFRPRPPKEAYSFRSTFLGALLENPRVSFLKDLEKKQGCLSFEAVEDKVYRAQLEVDKLKFERKTFDSGDVVLIAYCSE